MRKSTIYRGKSHHVNLLLLFSRKESEQKPKLNNLRIIPSMPSTVAPEKSPHSEPTSRTLIVAPPSISSKQDVLEAVFENHNRSTTDLQMLDRLAAGIITLPSDKYDLVLLLSEPQGSAGEAAQFVTKDVMLQLVQSMRAGARIRRQNGTFGTVTAERTEALLAGLLEDGTGGMVKPSFSETSAVPLRLGGTRKTKKDHDHASANGSSAVTNANGKRDGVSAATAENERVNGVGFVDFSDDLESELITGEDDELVDEDSLLTEADLARPVVQRKL